MEAFTHDTYLSPFTWRYGSPEMRAIWSEAHKRRLWRRIWVALAEAEEAAGLVTAAQVTDLRAHQDDIDLARAHEIEAEIHHDLMAEVRTYAGQCPVGGGIIHLGATSADVEDNADVLRVRESLDLLLGALRGLLAVFAAQIERWADAPAMAFTHLQPAEPTTVGYRLAQYAQDLLADYDDLRRVREALRGKGFKGAVGTSASYVQLLQGNVILSSPCCAAACAPTRNAWPTGIEPSGGPALGQTNRLKPRFRQYREFPGSGANGSSSTISQNSEESLPRRRDPSPDDRHAATDFSDPLRVTEAGSEMASAGEFEATVMAALGLEAFPVATQTYPRKQDYRVISALAGLGATLYKFAFDLRVLQSPPIGEWAEPFGSRQVGSSAMPFKRNPIHAENMDSLARYLAALPRVAWDNAAHSLLERTLDDSANRRSLLPEAFLIADELLRRGRKLIEGLRVDRQASERLLAAYGPFAATERLLMELVKRGGDRQALHEVIRKHAMAAWVEVQAGRPNPLAGSLSMDSRITQYAAREQVLAWLDAADYVGDAPQRARQLAESIVRRGRDAG